MYPRVKKEVMESKLKKHIVVNLEEKDSRHPILYIEYNKQNEKIRILFPKSKLEQYEVIVK